MYFCVKPGICIEGNSGAQPICIFYFVTVGKKQRIVAPKKSVNAITTSSWRVGIEIKKQLKKEMSIGKQDETKQIKKIPGIETVTATPASCMVCLFVYNVCSVFTNNLTSSF